MQGKTSFHIYKDSYEIIEDLTDEEVGKLFRAIFKWQLGIEDDCDRITSMLLKPFVIQFKRENKSWLETCKRNAANGKKGGRPKNPENPVGSFGSDKTKPNPENPNKAIREDRIGEDKIRNEKRSIFVPPTVEQVAAYAAEKKIHPFDAEYFVNFYEMKNWIVGKVKMKNWKAAVSNAKTWEAHSRQRNGNFQHDSQKGLFQ